MKIVATEAKNPIIVKIPLDEENIAEISLEQTTILFYKKHFLPYGSDDTIFIFGDGEVEFWFVEPYEIFKKIFEKLKAERCKQTIIVYTLMERAGYTEYSFKTKEEAIRFIESFDKPKHFGKLSIIRQEKVKDKLGMLTVKTECVWSEIPLG